MLSNFLVACTSEYVVLMSESQIDSMIRNDERDVYEITSNGNFFMAHKIVSCDTFIDACNEMYKAWKEDKTLQALIETDISETGMQKN